MTLAERGLRRFGPFVIGVAEIVALVMVSRWIGLGWAILLLLSTSVIGFALLRFEGFRAWVALRQAAADGRMDDAADGELAGDGSAGADPAARIADTGVRILSGVLMTLPGFITDLFALMLLIPPIRRSMGRRLSAAAFRTFPARMPGPTGQSGAGGQRGQSGGGSGGQRGPGSQSGGTQHRPVVIEGEVVDTDRDR